MNKNIEQLYLIANKRVRTVIGLMSGTSVDGLDVALCRFTGTGMESNMELVHFNTVPYDTDYKDEIAGIFSKRQVDLQKLCLLNPWIAEQHASIILACLDSWKVDPVNVDLVASHGQTIFHAPKTLHGLEKFSNATLQLGDGDHLAVKTGIITVSDFRQKHIAAGGEGAPLAAYGDYLMFSRQGENRILLNIGGIANFTFLPDDLVTDKVFCSDTGPGNTMMDAYVRKHFPGQFFDQNSGIAKEGTVNQTLLSALLDHPFFQQRFPKTTGPELFNATYLDAAMKNAGIGVATHADVLATLNRFSAVTIANAINSVIDARYTYHFFVSGGGMHNPLLLENLGKLLPGIVFRSTSHLHVNPDAKEAVLFAVLANEAICGQSLSFGTGTNGIPGVSMGKISFPA
jgi:anhydro-N-acetylmuramic acid kinase